MIYLVLIPLIIFSLSPYAPQPGDIEKIQGAAYITYQDEYIIQGWKPTPCHELRVNGERVYTVLDPDARCMQTLTYFEINRMVIP